MNENYIKIKDNFFCDEFLEICVSFVTKRKSGIIKDEEFVKMS